MLILTYIYRILVKFWYESYDLILLLPRLIFLYLVRTSSWPSLPDGHVIMREPGFSIAFLFFKFVKYLYYTHTHTWFSHFLLVSCMCTSDLSVWVLELVLQNIHLDLRFCFQYKVRWLFFFKKIKINYFLHDLRYLRRGVNEKGRVANDVETEQIVSEECQMKISSVVQHRGSIPLFWSHETSRMNIKPDIICMPLEHIFFP